MDRRTRELERHWKETGEYHAELLRALMRDGLLEEDRIICAGFFGHKASREAMPENIKKRFVIYKHRKLNTEEMKDFVKNIFAFPRDIYFRATIGAMKISARQIEQKIIRDDIKMMISHLEAYSVSFSDEDIRKLRRSHRRRRDWWRTWRTASRRQYRLKNTLADIFYQISRDGVSRGERRSAAFSGLNTMSAEFKDKHYKGALKEEVLPYVLGEWYE